MDNLSTHVHHKKDSKSLLPREVIEKKKKFLTKKGVNQLFNSTRLTFFFFFLKTVIIVCLCVCVGVSCLSVLIINDIMG